MDVARLTELQAQKDTLTNEAEARVDHLITAKDRRDRAVARVVEAEASLVEIQEALNRLDADILATVEDGTR